MVCCEYEGKRIRAVADQGRISQIALHTPDPLLSDDEFLVVTWGIILCTIVGPLAVGVIVKRWGRLVLIGGLE